MSLSCSISKDDEEMILYYYKDFFSVCGIGRTTSKLLLDIGTAQSLVIMIIVIFLLMTMMI